MRICIIILLFNWTGNPVFCQNFFDHDGRWAFSRFKDYIILESDRWRIINSSIEGISEKLEVSKTDTVCRFNLEGQYVCEVKQRNLELKLTPQTNGLKVEDQNNNTSILFSESNRPEYHPRQNFPPLDSQSYTVIVKGIILPSVRDSFESEEGNYAVVNDYLTSEQFKYYFNVDQQGYFEFKVPLVSAQDIFIKLDKLHYLFVEPGQTQFVIINNYAPDSWLFMGSMADINKDFQAFNNKVNSFAHQWQQNEDIVPLDPEDYSLHRKLQKDSLYAVFENYTTNHHVSAALKFWMNKHTQFTYHDDLLRYAWIRKYHNNRNVLVNHQNYFSFINEIPVSDASNSATTSYGSVLHELIMHANRKSAHWTSHPPRSFWQDLLQQNINSNERQIILERLSFEENPPEEVKLFRELWAQEGQIIQPKLWSIKDNYQDSIFYLMLTKHSTMSMIEQTNLKKGIQMWYDQMAFGSAITKKYQAEFRRALELQRLNFLDSLGQHSLFLKQIGLGRLFVQAINEMDVSNSKYYLDQLIAINPPRHISGYYQELYHHMEEQLKMPLPNFATLTESKEGSAEQFLQQLTKKHAGKLLYVDVWATWCGPCIMEFSHAPKLKENFVDLPVSFVYLCTSGNKQNWTNLINRYQLDGDHYFIDQSLSGKINEALKINGYPSYILIDQTGRVVTYSAPRPSQESHLKQEILKHIK